MAVLKMMLVKMAKLGAPLRFFQLQGNMSQVDLSLEIVTLLAQSMTEAQLKVLTKRMQ